MGNHNGESTASLKLSQAKTFGGIGSILVLLSIVPYAGFILGILGLVLVLIAVKYISDEVKDPKVFRNMLYSVLIGIIGTVIASFTVFGALFTMGFTIGVIGGPTQQPFPQPGGGMDIGAFFTNIILTIIAFFIAIWIIFIISAIFLRRSFTAISSYLGAGLFSTAALLYLIGAALTIIMVGFIVILIAWILTAVAFFTLPNKLPQQTQPTEGTES